MFLVFLNEREFFRNVVRRHHRRLKCQSAQKIALMRACFVLVPYGSINLLSYGSAQESIMRIESSNIANELIKSIEHPSSV